MTLEAVGTTNYGTTASGSSFLCRDAHCRASSARRVNRGSNPAKLVFIFLGAKRAWARVRAGCSTLAAGQVKPGRIRSGAEYRGSSAIGGMKSQGASRNDVQMNLDYNYRLSYPVPVQIPNCKKGWALGRANNSGFRPSGLRLWWRIVESSMEGRQNFRYQRAVSLRLLSRRPNGMFGLVLPGSSRIWVGETSPARNARITRI